MTNLTFTQSMQQFALESFGQGVLQAALVIFIFMSGFFLFALMRRRNDIADIIWGIGFIVVAWTSVWSFGAMYDGVSGELNLQMLLVASVVTLWGLRLATHIFIRNYKKEEDFRYKKWREDWGKWFIPRSYLQIFILQGFLMLLISVPVIALASYGKGTVSFVTLLGLLVWIDGFIFESFGDYQLKKFISNPENKGKIMKSGLWKYTRHPNYYGEVSQWWGVYLMCLPLIWPLSIIAIIGPLTITFLILKVSGIPMLEKKYDDNPEFQEYKKVTNAFFPWFPKNN
jgi:steroid 5-alpha reductase family enzyme